MSDLKIIEEMIALEKLLNDFIDRAKKNSKRIAKVKRKKFLFGFSKHKLLSIFVILYFISCLFYYIVNATIAKSQITNDIKLALLITIIFSIIGLIISLYYESYIIFRNAQKIENKLIIKSDIRKNYKLIQKIDTFSTESVAHFEEKLKSKIEESNEKAKDFDSLLPLSIAFMIFATKYVIGINVAILGQTISSLTGGLSLIAVSSTLAKVFLPNSKKNFPIIRRIANL